MKRFAMMFALWVVVFIVAFTVTGFVKSFGAFKGIAQAAANERNGYCEAAIKSLKPEWAPEEWKVYCVDEVPLDGVAHAEDIHELDAVTYKFPKVILIKRSLELDVIHYQLLHEYGHAYEYARDLKSSQKWKDFEKLKEHAIPASDKGYHNSSSEIFADNIARCALKYPWSISGQTLFPCHELTRLFPEVSTKQSKYGFSVYSWAERNGIAIDE